MAVCGNESTVQYGDYEGVAYYAVIFTVNVVQVVMYAVSHSVAPRRL